MWGMGSSWSIPPLIVVVMVVALLPARRRSSGVRQRAGPESRELEKGRRPISCDEPRDRWECCAPVSGGDRSAGK